jgi:hypothetical protein
VVVEVEGSRVTCNGVPGPTYLLRDGEEVSFVVVPGAATRPDPPDLRWTASVAVVGGDVQMTCVSDAELTATIAAQRDRWEAAGIDDYEYTLHWEEFSYLGGGYRVSVIDGQPRSVVRVTEPIAGPDAATIDLSLLPATIDEVFDVIEGELDADRVVACYDAELGYPVDVLIDRILNNEDDETTIAITELTAAGSPLPSTGCPSSAAAGTISMTCDVYRIGPDGTIEATPVRTGVRGFSTVASAEIIDETAESGLLRVRIPSHTLQLTPIVEQFSVRAHADFVRVFGVTGGDVLPESVIQTPAEHAPATSAGSTVSLGFDASVPGGRAVALPAAQFVVVPDDPSTTVEVSLLEYESTLTLEDSDGSTLRVHAVCAADPNVLAAGHSA